MKIPFLIAVLAPGWLLFLPEARSESTQKNGFIAEGTEGETPYHIIDSGEEGPVFLLVGGIHGDEPAGAIAAEQIRHWPLQKGKLIVIPRANRVALESRTRRFPGLSGDEGDLNRHFPRGGDPEETLSFLAEALWGFVKEQNPDWVVDLHEGSAIHRIDPRSVGSTIIYLPSDGEEIHFEHALATVNASIDDPGKLFVPLTKTGGFRGQSRPGRERAARCDFGYFRDHLFHPSSRGQGQTAPAHGPPGYEQSGHDRERAGRNRIQTGRRHPHCGCHLCRTRYRRVGSDLPQ